jgi:hypothetical protein
MHSLRHNPKSQQHAQTLNRRVADLRGIAAQLKKSRMSPLQVCEAIIERRLIDPHGQVQTRC